MTFAVGIHQFLDNDVEIPLEKSHNNLKWRSFCYVSTILLKTFRLQYIASQARSKDWLSECLRASFPIFPLSARWSLAFLANNILVNVVFSEKQEFIVLLFNHIGQPSYGQYEATSHGQNVNSIHKNTYFTKIFSHIFSQDWHRFCVRKREA